MLIPLLIAQSILAYSDPQSLVLATADRSAAQIQVERRLQAEHNRRAQELQKQNVHLLRVVSERMNAQNRSDIARQEHAALQKTPGRQEH